MAYNSPNPVGITLASLSAPVTRSVQHIVGAAKTTPAVNYEFLTDSASGWFDALGFSWASFTVVTGAAVTGGVLSFECTNDTTSAPGGVTLLVQDSTGPATGRTASITLAASTTYQLDGPVTARYIRVRVSTSVTAGTVTVSSLLQQSAPPSSAQASYLGYVAMPTGSAAIGNIDLNTGVADIGYVVPASLATLDTTATITVDTLSSAVSTDNNSAASFSVITSSITGITPTLDVVVKESYDGTNYTDLYHFERISTNNTFITPVIALNGQLLKYNFAVGGTAPSFQVNVYRNTKSSSGLLHRQYYDRTIDANTISSTTGVYLSHGTHIIHMSVCSGAATTACSIDLQASVDRTTWYTIATVVSAATSTTQVSTTAMGKWVRGIVSTAGSGQTINYIQFTGIGPS